MNRARTAIGVLAIALAIAGPASAQLTGFSVTKNAGNSGDEAGGFGLIGITAFDRVSTVSVITTNSNTARAVYRAIVAADSRQFIFNGSRTENHTIDWSASFNVTAPGAYLLHVSQSLSGAFTINGNSSNNAEGDLSAIVGTQTGATQISGTGLNVGDPNFIVATVDTNVPFLATNAADFRQTSNGVAKPHTFRFTGAANCISNNNGDGCAVRLGISAANVTAGQYPGQGSRVASDDGNFFSVWVESLCGNGIVDAAAGEQCDQGQFNGSSCCTTTCQFEPNGHVCRASAGVCDVAETCSGAAGGCPINSFLPFNTSCRPAVGPCDAAEVCTGASDACPVDGKRAASFVCRASTDVCDAVENCDGVTDSCPADVAKASGTPCRLAVPGGCDLEEQCDGSSFACPADVVENSGVECRASAGVCDPAEVCTGSSNLCPTDSVSGAFVECRAVAGACDEAENCNGISVDCPPDAFLGSHGGAFICRPTAGICDPEEQCDGLGPNCPPDVIEPSGTLCRAATGVCDVAENCDGVNPGCPADSVSGAFVVCRPAAGNCDVDENCNGVGKNCPGDIVLPATTICRPSTGICDVTDYCSGSSGVCPADVGEPDTDTDTVCDPDDNCPTITNTNQSDTDNDGRGDVCDLCSNANVQTTKTSLVIKQLSTPPGDDKLSYKGQMIIPLLPELDPLNKGVHLNIVDATNATVLDVNVPPGLFSIAQQIGWTGNAPSKIFKYKNRTNLGPVNGIEKITLKKANNPPGLLKFAIKGKRGSYGLNTANLPLTATLIVEGPLGLNGQCAQSVFPGPTPLPSCVKTGAGAGVRCK